MRAAWGLVWPIRDISSFVEAPVAAASVLPGCLRSYKRRCGSPCATPAPLRRGGGGASVFGEHEVVSTGAHVVGKVSP